MKKIYIGYFKNNITQQIPFIENADKLQTKDIVLKFSLHAVIDTVLINVTTAINTKK